MESNLPKRLVKRSDFEKLLRKGERFYPNSLITINYMKSKGRDSRVGWTVPKYVGSAVVRNKMKRWCREFVRDWARESAAEDGYDINIVFKRKGPQYYKEEVKHNEVERGLRKSFERIFKTA